MNKFNILLYQSVKANKNNYHLKQENGEQQIFTKFHEINVCVQAMGNYYGLQSISHCKGQASSSTASSRPTERSIVGQSHFRLGNQSTAHRVYYYIQVWSDNAQSNSISV